MSNLWLWGTTILQLLLSYLLVSMIHWSRWHERGHGREGKDFDQ